MMRALAALVVAAPLLAQGIAPGVRFGAMVTQIITTDGPQQAFASPFAIGPCIEIHLWRGLAVGADFLVGRTTLAALPTPSPHADVWQWELPATGVYRFRFHAHPFLRAGVAFNHVFRISGATECGRGPFGEQFYCIEGAPLAELRHRGTSGIVLGGGLRLKVSGLWFEPELRATHWRDRNFGVRGSAVRSDLNQIALLLGVVF